MKNLIFILFAVFFSLSTKAQDLSKPIKLSVLNTSTCERYTITYSINDCGDAFIEGGGYRDYFGTQVIYPLYEDCSSATSLVLVRVNGHDYDNDGDLYAYQIVQLRYNLAKGGLIYYYYGKPFEMDKLEDLLQSRIDFDLEMEQITLYGNNFPGLGITLDRNTDYWTPVSSIELCPVHG